VKNKMQKYTKIVLATAVLLVLTSWAVFADGSDDVKDWWTEMADHHQATHGDDFAAHHQGMHGDDWQEHVAGCHETTGDGETTTTEGHMGSGAGTMMSATMM